MDRLKPSGWPKRVRCCGDKRQVRVDSSSWIPNMVLLRLYYLPFMSNSLASHNQLYYLPIVAFQRTTRSEREQSRIGVATSTRAPNPRPGVRAGSRAPPTRYGSSIATRNGAASPTPSVASVATVNTIGTKRKERDFEAEASTQETNIQVVVRCRGRNEREVRENSNVVVTADSVRGKVVELSMGSNALSNRSYNFDRVFSPAADQYMVFDDTVKPILDEMLSGYNCTIFAYGQTGTGKTYTMSGDMTETMGMLSDDAGIIPRVLQTLFTKLELENAESTIKCSFIELYNEELRDLLASDDGTKLKIYDDTSRRGHASTIVQGMEEKHIKDAAEGVKVLQEGSLKRQVAATKCNDLSSRSHTVFTITTYVRKPNEHGVEALVSAGKLNLVDLAGSENIQRSGAENKRATEAGLINKSLLTLGRVINALVDKGSHIPYRESKLTRLLQDSLGGRTKTCIIATISPAKSNLEETISTLEYAFRAKNIKNKPQMNPMIEKKTLLKDFTMEIERLKSELIATRQRNGVYLSNESYEEMTAQSESRRIVNEEQSAKLETLEKNLRNKVQELFSLQSTFLGLKKDHEGTRAQLDDTKEVLDQTEIVLSATRQSLSEETKIRKAHQKTEQKLTEVGGELIEKLHKTVSDVGGLHAKNRRKSDLQSINRNTWTTSQNQVADVTAMVERRIGEFQEEQQEHIASVGQRMGSFVDEELRKLSTTQAFLDEHLSTFAESRKELLESKQKSKDDMDGVLEGIKVVRDTVKERMGENLQSISQSAERIAADMMNEMTAFHGQLHNSYSELGKDFKSVFEELVKHITAQRAECDNLKQQLQSATSTIVLQNATISSRIQDALTEERRLAVDDRQNLMAQISTLINAQAETQESRLQAKASEIQKTITSTSTSLEQAVESYGEGMSSWDLKEGEMLEEVKKSRDQLKTKLQDDWTAADDHSSSIQATAKSVHAETVRAVDEQIKDLDVQMEALDDFVTRARTENGHHHETHNESVKALSSTVEESFGNISAHFKSTFDRVKNLGEEMEVDLGDLQEVLEPMKDQLCQPLSNLREDITGAALQEYQPTGETPAKVQYHYPTDLPRTEDHDLIISSIDEVITPTRNSESTDKDATIVFADLDSSPHKMMTSPVRPATRMSMASASEHMGMPSSLREVNPNVPGNVTTGSVNYNPRASIISMPPERTMPLFKRPTRVTRSTKKVGSRDPIISEGGENVLPTALEESLARRKSPRIN
ncbi:Kinesin- motor protein [Fusarium poae]